MPYGLPLAEDHKQKGAYALTPKTVILAEAGSIDATEQHATERCREYRPVPR